MIIGNGLVANTLTGINHEDSIIFASGVSNSRETRPEMFKRELDLLLSQNRKERLIYFSTCSITDPTLTDTNYVKHKIHIENLIKEEFTKHLILRLPTLVGKTNNPHTFFNHIKDRVLKNNGVVVYKNAWRYLLDADDLKVIVPALMNTPEAKNTIFHIAYDNAMSVYSIVLLMDKILNKTSSIKLLDKGSHFQIETDELSNFLSKNNIRLYSDNYNEDVIRKYLK